jgi:aryl-alcohol dehydrogenase-like predicted oxidoreductase
VKAQSLIRYALGLPISVAVIGVKDIEQLKANVRVVKQTQPMNYVEQEELEQVMG